MLNQLQERVGLAIMDEMFTRRLLGKMKRRTQKMKMNKLQVSGKNLLKLILIAHPLFFILVWVQALFQGAEGSREISYSIEVGLFYYLGSILYIILAGIIYNVALLFIPSSMNETIIRIIGVILTCLIPLLIILFGERYQTIAEFLIPVIIAMFTYGMIVHFPNAYEEDYA